MMTQDDYRHFVCIVAGDNPTELMGPYFSGKKVDPYIIYKYKDADKIRQKYVESYEEIAKTADGISAEYARNLIEELKDMDIDQFYYEVSEDLGAQIDEEGNIVSDKNKDGKWGSYCIGKLFSIPFLKTNGEEAFQARKGDIAWDRIHLAGGDIYARAWEMVMENSKPESDYEKQIYENMKDKQAYFQKFESKENYVTSNTAFWGYAFVSEKNGWSDASEVEDQFIWMSNFFDLFIKGLSDDTLLTIYECTK